MRSHGRWRGLAAGVLFVLILGAGPAAADEPGESDEARVLVQQAIALMVNTPGEEMAIEERVEDALAAAHTEGVDMTQVEAARQALAAGDLRRSRSLLEEAIGAGPYGGNGTPRSIRESLGEPGKPAYAVGAQTGTTVVLEEYEPDAGLDGGEWLLLGLSLGTAVAGLALARRWRPPDSIRSLRRMQQPGAA